MMEELNWDNAKRKLEEVRESILLTTQIPGVNMYFYAGVVSGLQNRFDKGERTESLFREIMELS